uniref:NADH dehydrogenase subunit 6 n=1 Tax=Coladenia agnioides TaxID=2866479 RepID=UPI0030FF28CD
MKLILFSSMTFISIFMLFLKHPLSMGFMILIQTILICLISGLYLWTYWFSYILFLTFLGGLLVLFIYVSSIASNELFHFSYSNKLILMLFFLFLIFFMFFIYNFNLFNNLIFYSFKSNKISNYLFFLENNINLTKLYNEQTYFLMFLMIIYLLITLIIVVKITNIFYGPLRSN